MKLNIIYIIELRINCYPAKDSYGRLLYRIIENRYHKLSQSHDNSKGSVDNLAETPSGSAQDFGM